jgi:hypothetical protein
MCRLDIGRYLAERDPGSFPEERGWDHIRQLALNTPEDRPYPFLCDLPANTRRAEALRGFFGTGTTRSGSSASKAQSAESGLTVLASNGGFGADISSGPMTAAGRRRVYAKAISMP